MEPTALFGIQFTLSLVAYALLAFWYVTPRLSRLPRNVALAPLLWIHAFRVVGGTIALLALIALRARLPGAIALVWLCIGVGLLDTVNAIIQSVRFNVFTYPLGVNWVIVSIYVPALLVSSLLVIMQLRRPNRSAKKQRERMSADPHHSAAH